MVVLTLLSLAYVGFKVYGFMRRSGRNFCELPVGFFKLSVLAYKCAFVVCVPILPMHPISPQTLFFMIAECCSLVAGIVFAILLITCLFILIFFKSQIPLIFVLPTDSQEVLYIVLVALGLLCEVRKCGCMPEYNMYNILMYVCNSMFMWYVCES